MAVRIAPFRVDVTPPLGHPLCGGWITSAQSIVDHQWANGLVLSDGGAPVVLVTVDWCEIRNHGYDQWTQAIAAATGTTFDRVAVHCVHPHDAPFADPEAERLLRRHGASGTSLDLEYFDSTVRAVAAAAGMAARSLKPVTHLGTGQARVEHVASNRRIVSAEGRVGPMRGSACRDAALRDAPEGLIDPYLKTVSFWEGGTLVAALHYYATHPMSHYGKGGVSCDFCGLARDRMATEAGGAHLYFTGGAGNIGAGKYNDGSPEMRTVLTERILAGMRSALAGTTREPLDTLCWQTEPVLLPNRAGFTRAHYLEFLENAAGTHLERCRGAFGLSWLDRVEAKAPIRLSCLGLNETSVLHLPGEPFIEYQLFAQQTRPDRFVAVAGYGDCGPGYLPTAAAYPQGGYEASWVALVAPEAEELLNGAIRHLLTAPG